MISIRSTDLSGKVRPTAPDSSDDEDEVYRLNIAQAFADDDVAEEFSARRKRKCLVLICGSCPHSNSIPLTNVIYLSGGTCYLLSNYLCHARWLVGSIFYCKW